MKRSRFTEEQIIAILREADGESTTKAVCAKHNISVGTFYAWKRKYGGMEVEEARRLRALEDEYGRLRRLVADLSVQNQIRGRSERKKVVSPSAKRRAVRFAVEEGLGSSAGAYRALGLARSTFYRSSSVKAESRQLHNEIIELSQKHPRYGYRRITALMRRAGRTINEKRVLRVRREAGFIVHKRQRRMKRQSLSSARRHRAQTAMDVWSWDFVSDQTENGDRFRILTLIDEYTRECHATYVSRSIPANDVITVIEEVIAERGAPRHIRSDNGPEFIAQALQDWLDSQEIKTLYIKARRALGASLH